MSNRISLSGNDRNHPDKRPRVVREGDTTGMMSPVSRRVKINIPVKESDNGESQNSEDADEDSS